MNSVCAGLFTSSRSVVGRRIGASTAFSANALARRRSVSSSSFASDAREELMDQRVSNDKHTLVIDLGGTLVDGSSDIAKAINIYLANKGFDIELDRFQCGHMIGDGAARITSRALESVGMPGEDPPLAEIEAFRAIYDNLDTSGTILYDGIVDTLEELSTAGHRMILCTNKDQKKAEAILSHFKIAKFFTAVVGGNVIPVKKPNAGHLIYAVEMGGGDINRCLMIGDGHNDVKVAKAAGVPCIALSNGYSKIPLAELKPNLIIENFNAVPGALEKLVDASTY